MTAKIDGNKLVITLDMNEPVLSQSGKTLVVASTRGIVNTSATVNGKTVQIGVNAFIAR